MASTAPSVAGSTIFRGAKSSSTQLKKIITIDLSQVRPSITTEEAITKAVYGHIRAVRALGRTTISTTDIARALGIAPLKVIGSINSLKLKGVKVSP